MSKDTEREAQDSPEVSEKASRRRFKAEYKARVLDEADRCTEPGQVGELLR
jgi:transposase